MSNALKNIRRLEQARCHLDNQIQREKKRQRFLDAKYKKNLGRLFLLAGLGNYFPAALPLNQVIQIGAFLKIVKVDREKRSHLLGVLATLCESCSQQEQKAQLEKNGESFFTDHKKLAYPFSLAMGIAMEAEKLIVLSSQQIELTNRGEALFRQHQIEQLKNRQLAALKKISITTPHERQERNDA